VKTNGRKLSDLHNEFKAKSRQLYFGQVSGQNRKEVILDRQRIVKEIWQIKSSESQEKPNNLRIAGSHSSEFVNKLGAKGIVFRHVGS